MKIIWTVGAVDDLTVIFNYIRQDSSDAARKVVRTIYDRLNSLPAMPHKGRKRADQSRELISLRDLTSHCTRLPKTMFISWVSTNR